MRIKDLIIAVGFAVGITMLFQYLFLGKTDDKQVVAERVRIMPKTDVYRPLDIEVHFWEKNFNIEPVQTQVETDFAQFTFSNEGAALVKADFKHTTSGQTILMPGIKSLGKEDRSFMLAFNKKTPYYFELVSNQETTNVVKLEYKADFDGGSLTKIFTIYKEKPQIDLHISFDPVNTLSEPYRLRLMYDIPSILHAANPEQAELLQINDDALFGIVDSYGKVVKKPVAAILDRYWENPVNFGGIDKYLVITTINNDSDFAQRGYYNLYSDNLLKAFLESPEIGRKTEWNVSFYIGPKQASAFDKVDTKLDQLLDLGMLAPISKLLLRLMNFFYRFVGNFGWAIILLTLLVKIVSLPFSWRIEQNTKKAGEMQRKLDYVQQKYRNDPEALARAKAEVMQKYGMSSIGGCLVPIIIQTVVFIALRSVLTTSLELFMSPFLWVSNLVNPDPLYIFPLLGAVCLFIKMANKESDARKKLNSLGIAVFVGALFANFSAGLTLHVLVSSLLDILQTKLYKKYGSA